MTQRRQRTRTVLQGIGAAPGLGLGPARVFAFFSPRIELRRVGSNEVGREIRRFRSALRGARNEIRDLRKRLGRGSEDPGDQILAAHEMILTDPELRQEVAAAIKAERFDAAYAVRWVLGEKAQYLSAQANAVFRSRAADFQDVTRRLIGRLLGSEVTPVAQLPTGAVIVAAEIPPSETAAIDPQRVAAMVTARGTLASHATILARSRGVPAVIGLGVALDEIPEGETVIVDGERGIVIVAPNETDVAEFHADRDRATRIAALVAGREESPAITLDDRRIAVLANIDRPEDAPAASAAGAEGIGLFRTEFFFLEAARFPDESVQHRAYETVARAFGERPVVIRTLDLGGDKHADLMGIDREENPFLGLRGIRFCLAHPEFFVAQLRAILRAAVAGRVKILLPMVSHVDEIRATRALIADARANLVREGVPLTDEVPVGVMIEVPSAVFTSDNLAREADFFSIGSNDLIQYALAADRGNERVADLYDALDPAVVRAIAATVRGAQEAGIPVSSCGEMSGELPGLLLLAGLGVTELSVAPLTVTRVKEMLRRVRLADLEMIARECLCARDRREVWDAIRAGLRPYEEFQFEKRDGRWLCRWQPPAAEGAR